MHFPPMPVGLEPCPDIGVLVVGGVVLNQNRSLTAVSPSELFEEAKVGSSTEDMVLAIVQPCAPEFDGTPRIFTFLRSPVTGTSGGHPTRLQVAWMVESCRKLASSVKMSAQCRERAFF